MIKSGNPHLYLTEGSNHWRIEYPSGVSACHNFPTKADAAATLVKLGYLFIKPMDKRTDWYSTAFKE